MYSYENKGHTGVGRASRSGYLLSVILFSHFLQIASMNTAVLGRLEV